MNLLQDTFNELLIHLRALGGNKALQDGQPVYKTDDGESGCPVGRLLGVEVYNKELEGKSTNSGEVRAALITAGHDWIIPHFFQMVHDNVCPERWEDYVYILARDLGLEYFPPENYKFVEGIEVLDMESLVGPAYADLIGILRETVQVEKELSVLVKEKFLAPSIQ